jgi:sec-independent protein translocase protein TatA
MGNLGLPEILIIFFVILIFFGGKKIPEIAKGLGEGIRSFKKSISDDDSDDKIETDEKDEKDTPKIDK